MRTLHYWKWIEENIIEFNLGLSTNSIATSRFSQFFHWYYHPGFDLFGPSKFIGYQNTTHENYDGFGCGGSTQELLRRFFVPVTVEEYEYYLNGLINVASKYGLNVSQKTKSGASGWIYKPNQLVLDTFIEPLLRVDDDLLSIESEFVEPSSHYEGNSRRCMINMYERNPKLRKQAIAIHGTTCMVCKFDFEARYGKKGKGFIEVHHKVPLYKLKKQTKVDPRTDMVVLCSNCHRMIHREKDNPMTIHELKKLVES